MTLRTPLLYACLLLVSACASHPGQALGPHETRASLLADFKKADANGDEQLSKDEMNAGLPRYAADFDEIDTDHNGTVSKPELAALTNKLFDVADTDHNGQLSEQELTTFAANMNKVLAFLQ